jgi:hypothetical protein
VATLAISPFRKSWRGLRSIGRSKALKHSTSKVRLIGGGSSVAKFTTTSVGMVSIQN